MRAVSRRSPSHRLGARAVALGMAVAAFGSACSSSAYVYVASSDHKAYFKVPGNWTFYGKDDLLMAMGLSRSAAADRQNPFLVGFDSSPDPSAQHVIDGLSLYPSVLAQVAELAPLDRDLVSLYALRNRNYDLEKLVQDNRAQILTYEDITLPGGYRGHRIVFDIFLLKPVSSIGGNAVLRVDQTELLDAATSRLYTFLVRCESHCFADNGDLIDQIVQSWTVKER